MLFSGQENTDGQGSPGRLDSKFLCNSKRLNQPLHTIKSTVDSVKLATDYTPVVNYTNRTKPLNTLCDHIL